MSMAHNSPIDFESMSDLTLAVTLLELARELARRHGTRGANRRLARRRTSIGRLERWVAAELDRSVAI
ncbi:hypothetical protein A5685_05160 [Mycobacterium colombiense]|uniref:Uncharacterized protein n=1 Tax=Mycobacterium colombiense TaxID=339268 RepID=A0A1A2S435_9MYCO|nr:hypothetical protein [Mycobacterium colombiense]OBH58770.1 hypothetical protein A5685_05160 [Mycobacterium colombiense]